MQQPDSAALNRVRNLLKHASSRGVSSAQLRLEGRSKAAVEADRWKQIFSAFDTDGSGTLNCHEFCKAVRGHLHLAQRAVSDWELRLLFGVIDTDSSGTVDFNEWLFYLQHGKTKDEDRGYSKKALENVGRAVRIALQRDRLQWEDVIRLFKEHERAEAALAATEADGQIGLGELRRFFRNVLAISQHEVSEENIRTLFKHLDKDESKSIGAEEFFDFVHFLTAAEANAHAAFGFAVGGRDNSLVRPPGHLLAGARGVATARERAGDSPTGGQCHASGRLPTLTGAPSAAVPFSMLTGREHLPATRMTTALQRLERRQGPAGLKKVQSEPGLAVSLPPIPPGGSTASTGGARGVPAGQAAASDAAPGLAASRPAPGGGTRAGAPVSGVAGGVKPGARESSRYWVFNGAQLLNRVESRLEESGVDVRGGYHRVDRIRPVFIR